MKLGTTEGLQEQMTNDYFTQISRTVYGPTNSSSLCANCFTDNYNPPSFTQMTERQETLDGLYKLYAEARANDNVAFSEEIMRDIISVGREEERVQESDEEKRKRDLQT